MDKVTCMVVDDDRIDCLTILAYLRRFSFLECIGDFLAATPADFIRQFLFAPPSITSQLASPSAQKKNRLSAVPANAMFLRGSEQIRTAVEAFAELCLATRPRNLEITLIFWVGANLR